MKKHTPYQDYKKSGIRTAPFIPIGWNSTNVKRVIQFETGWTPPTSNSSNFDGDGLWANISDLGQKRIKNTQKRICPIAASKLGMKKIPKDSLMFSFKLSVGQVSFADVEMFTNEAIATFLPNRDISLPFMFYALPYFVTDNSSENIYGAKILNQQLIRDAKIAVPPLPEQIAIASFLDRETAKIDLLIQKQERLIEVLQEKRICLISNSVTKGLAPNVLMKNSGVDGLGMIPEHWKVLSLQRCVRVKEGQVDPEKNPYRTMLLIAPNHVESGTGKILYTETAEEQAAESGKYFCSSGDVIYSKIRPNLRKVCIAPEDCLCSADMYPLKGFNQLSNQFLKWFILSDYFSAVVVLESERVAMPKINRESLKAIHIALPPEDEQRAIVHHIEAGIKKLDELCEKSSKAILLLKERRSALISAAVTGKIDVREAA